ncbi:hypothetical protein L226DRAFT_538391 [Lentinus tigrinus ALCF2SS1-7]|uniref:F-box domain-containing protein n=1 Tax=Lentinus tigrinus ALCF2SS1-6 TaxID=1328759 RepID=A0A5C2RZ02_9APHY|nr:hypothetical protein L227DRAFT_578962 [Lentinus tigrinus ALCF2SS1-6]RPD71013.1 hypothetical protein L226DRAFT_538391 [Lentinus tigrinus ALCF2SS1-7]
MSVRDHIANLTRALELEGPYMRDITLAVAALRTNLTKLLRLTNATLPINRVPQEVLVMIFSHATISDEHKFAYDLRGRGANAYDEALAVIEISHVCHHWRQTTLEAPTLWTRIDSRHPEILEMFMERSQKAPISLALDAEEEDLASLLSTVPADRLRRLDLMIDGDPSRDQVASLTTLVAPILECLTVNSGEDYYCGAAPLVWAHILDGQTYSMKALALRYVGHWMPSNIFPILTHLHLTLSSADIRTSDLVVLLANAPQLEFLFVEEQPNLPDREPSGSCPSPIVLSHLRYLTLDFTPYVQAMNLLKHLSLPERCFIRLSDVFIAKDDGEPSPLVDLGPLRHATALDIASVPGHRVLVVADSHISGLWIQAQLHDDITGNTWLLGLPTMINLSTVTSLHITIYRTHTFWPSVLKHFTALTELKAIVEGQDLGRMCPLDTLCTVLLEDPVLLPLLCGLYVQGVAWDDSCYKLSSKLVDMTAFRARTGHRLHHFFIQTNRPEVPQPHDLFGKRTTELVAHVDHFELVECGPKLCSFRMRDVWHIDGTERYWQLDGAQEYILPAEIKG